MHSSKLYLALFTLGLVLLSILPKAMQAQDVNHAALVIRHGDQEVQTACVEFSDPEISGLELLQQSGFSMALEVQGLGAAVCSIGQTGCPADDCWCQCKGGGECVYWSSWHQLGGAWEYSQAGASQYILRDGDIDGWSWGPGAINAALPPPDISFDQVCESSAITDPTATPTASDTATATPTSIAFIPQDTPTSEFAATQPLNTTEATLVPTVQATESTAPVASPIPVGPTPIAATPTIEAPLNPSPTVQLAAANAASEVPQDSIESQATAEISSDPVIDPDTIAEEPPSTNGSTEVQPTSEGVEVAALVEASTVARPVQRDAKHLALSTAVPVGELVVVGAAVDVPDQQPAHVSQDQVIRDDVHDMSTSPRSYGSFILIVAVLGGLLIFTSMRRRKRHNN